MSKENEEKTQEIEQSDFNEVLEALKAIMGKSTNEAIAEAIKDLSSDQKLMYFTDVDKREIPYLAVMKVIAKRYDIGWLDDQINYMLMLRVSDKRKGRTGLEKVIIGIRKTIEDRFKGILPKLGKREEIENV